MIITTIVQLKPYEKQLPAYILYIIQGYFCEVFNKRLDPLVDNFSYIDPSIQNTRRTTCSCNLLVSLFAPLNPISCCSRLYGFCVAFNTTNISMYIVNGVEFYNWIPHVYSFWHCYISTKYIIEYDVHFKLLPNFQL